MSTKLDPIQSNILECIIKPTTNSIHTAGSLISQGNDPFGNIHSILQNILITNSEDEKMEVMKFVVNLLSDIHVFPRSKNPERSFVQTLASFPTPLPTEEYYNLYIKTVENIIDLAGFPIDYSMFTLLESVSSIHKYLVLAIAVKKGKADCRKTFEEAYKCPPSVPVAIALSILIGTANPSQFQTSDPFMQNPKDIFNKFNEEGIAPSSLMHIEVLKMLLSCVIFFNKIKPTVTNSLINDFHKNGLLLSGIQNEDNNISYSVILKILISMKIQIRDDDPFPPCLQVSEYVPELCKRFSSFSPELVDSFKEFVKSRQFVINFEGFVDGLLKSPDTFQGAEFIITCIVNLKKTNGIKAFFNNACSKELQTAYYNSLFNVVPYFIPYSEEFLTNFFQCSDKIISSKLFFHICKQMISSTFIPQFEKPDFLYQTLTMLFVNIIGPRSNEEDKNAMIQMAMRIADTNAVPNSFDNMAELIDTYVKEPIKPGFEEYIKNALTCSNLIILVFAGINTQYSQAYKYITTRISEMNHLNKEDPIPSSYFQLRFKSYHNFATEEIQHVAEEICKKPKFSIFAQPFNAVDVSSLLKLISYGFSTEGPSSDYTELANLIVYLIGDKITPGIDLSPLNTIISARPNFIPQNLYNTLLSTPLAFELYPNIIKGIGFSSQIVSMAVNGWLNAQKGKDPQPDSCTDILKSIMEVLQKNVKNSDIFRTVIESIKETEKYTKNSETLLARLASILRSRNIQFAGLTPPELVQLSSEIEGSCGFVPYLIIDSYKLEPEMDTEITVDNIFEQIFNKDTQLDPNELISEICTFKEIKRNHVDIIGTALRCRGDECKISSLFNLKIPDPDTYNRFIRILFTFSTIDSNFDNFLKSSMMANIAYNSSSIFEDTICAASLYNRQNFVEKYLRLMCSGNEFTLSDSSFRIFKILISNIHIRSADDQYLANILICSLRWLGVLFFKKEADINFDWKAQTAIVREAILKITSESQSKEMTLSINNDENFISSIESIASLIFFSAGTKLLEAIHNQTSVILEYCAPSFISVLGAFYCSLFNVLEKSKIVSSLSHSVILLIQGLIMKGDIKSNRFILYILYKCQKIPLLTKIIDQKTLSFFAEAVLDDSIYHMDEVYVTFCNAVINSDKSCITANKNESKITEALKKILGSYADKFSIIFPAILKFSTAVENQNITDIFGHQFDKAYFLHRSVEQFEKFKEECLYIAFRILGTVTELSDEMSKGELIDILVSEIAQESKFDDLMAICQTIIENPIKNDAGEVNITILISCCNYLSINQKLYEKSWNDVFNFLKAILLDQSNPGFETAVWGMNSMRKFKYVNENGSTKM